jgi:hypothetical protein
MDMVIRHMEASNVSLVSTLVDANHGTRKNKLPLLNKLLLFYEGST